MPPCSCKTTMTKEELFEIWAPPNSRWSPWVKPVLFACMDTEPQLPAPTAKVIIPEQVLPTTAVYHFDTTQVPPIERNVALVLDLPGAEGVRAGLALASQGYRPVPLYNAVPGPIPSIVGSIGTGGSIALVDVTQILTALWHEGV